MNRKKRILMLATVSAITCVGAFVGCASNDSGNVNPNHSHSFKYYTYDGNATRTKDGTLTAKCEYCDERHTIVNSGSKLAHDYEDGVCKNCGTLKPTEGIVYSVDSYGVCYVADKGTATDARIILASEYEGKPVQYIGDRAFRFGKFESIMIPDSIKHFGDQAFEGCELTGIIIPKSVKQIGKNAFQACKNLSAVSLPDSVTNIGDDIFAYCDSLTEVILPDSITEIPLGAFIGCKNLSKIKLPENANVEDAGFRDCGSLTEICIGKGAAYIGNLAFEDCVNLTKITFEGTKEQWVKMYKKADWDKNAGEYTVICTDGKLDKNGNEIA